MIFFVKTSSVILNIVFFFFILIVVSKLKKIIEARYDFKFFCRR